MKLLNTIEIPLRWVDMDAYQHLNNTRFFDFMTEARACLFQKIKTSNMPCYLVVVDTHCNFKKSYIYPDTIVVKQYIKEKGHASFSLNYEFFSKNNPDILFAEGHAKMVCYDPKAEKAIAIPKVVLNFIK